MTSKRKRLERLQDNWATAKISVSFKPDVVCAKPFCSNVEVYAFLMSIWNRELINLQEQFMALYFNRRNQLIGWKLINTGTQTVTLVDVKFIVCLALQCMASSVIVAHNHPSGNLHPSRQDEYVTLQLKRALKLIDVKLLDHLIISDKGFFPLKKNGLI